MQNDILSDHYDNWSDKYAIQCVFTPTAPSALRRVALLTIDFSGFSGGALQTLWKSRLQVSSGAGTRPQVLPFGQSQRRSTRDGLCAFGLGRRSASGSGALSQGSSDSGRGLSDQPRTPETSRTPLGEKDVSARDSDHHLHQHQPGGDTGRQHARGLPEIRLQQRRAGA